MLIRFAVPFLPYPKFSLEALFQFRKSANPEQMKKFWAPLSGRNASNENETAGKLGQVNSTECKQTLPFCLLLDTLRRWKWLHLTIEGKQGTSFINEITFKVDGHALSQLNLTTRKNLNDLQSIFPFFSCYRSESQQREKMLETSTIIDNAIMRPSFCHKV